MSILWFYKEVVWIKFNMGVYCKLVNNTKKEYILCPIDSDYLKYPGISGCCNKEPIIVQNKCYSILLAFKILYEWNSDNISFVRDFYDEYSEISETHKDVSKESIRAYNKMYLDRYGKNETYEELKDQLIHPDEIK